MDGADVMPLYKHDCESCTFLGVYQQRDLYACCSAEWPPVLIARASSEGSDYEAVTLFGDPVKLERYRADHPLSEALRLYRERTVRT